MAIKTCGYGILGVGMHVPETVLTNFDLEKTLDTTDEWIRTRTGIRERHRVAEGENSSDMAIGAARKALENTGIEAEEIDLIICCTFTPDVSVPCVACMVQDQLGIAGRTPAFDLNAACTGFIYGVSVAISMMRTGPYKKALVIGVDATSRTLDHSHRSTEILFGDGAGAVVIGETGPDRGLIGDFLAADGSKSDALIVWDSGTAIRTEEQLATRPKFDMNGADIFKFATRVLGASVSKALNGSAEHLSIEDIDLFIPHQANYRIIESAAKKMKVPIEKFVINLDRYGNTSAASIPIAMSEAAADGRLKRGSIVALVAFGGGLTYGANIWIW